MKRFNFALATGVAAITLAISPASRAKDTRDISVAVIPKVAVPYFDDCNDGAKAEAEKLGVKYQWVVPQNTQGSTQVQIIEDLISKHVDGIAISVNEPKSVEGVIKRAEKAGIKVLTRRSDG
jgi:ribose transport system substrate-binding protein